MKEYLYKPSLPREPGDIRSILVVNPNHLGDMIMDSPVFRVLKEKFPRARLDVLTYSFTKPALYHNPYIDSLLDFPRTSFLKQAIVAFSMRRNKYHLILQLNTSLKTNFLMRLMGGVIRLGYDYKRCGFFNTVRIPIPTRTARTRYRVDESLDLFEKAFGWKIANRRMDFFVSEKEREKIAALWTLYHLDGAKIVFALHPHFRRTWKDEPEWSPEKFASLVNQLVLRYHAMIIMTGSVDDREFIGAICDAVERKENIVNLAGELSFHEVASLYEKVKLLISVNTGPVHAAIALKVPVLVLIRATPPFITLPKDNPLVRYLEGERDVPYNPYALDYELGSAIDKIEVSDVLAEIESMLDIL